MKYSEKIDTALQIITKEVSNGQLQKALQICDRLISKIPNSVEILEERLKILIFLKEYPEAIQQGYSIIKQFPNNSFSWRQIGLCHLRTKDFSEAEKAVVQAIQLEENGRNWALLGQVYRKSRRIDKASFCMQRAYELDPDDPQVITNLGLVQYDLGFFSDSATTHSIALNIAPDEATILVNLGNALRAKGDIPKALECYDHLLKIAPNTPGVEWNRAMTLLLGGDYVSGFKAMKGRFTQLGRERPEWLEDSWKGEPIDGTLLIDAEQGFGDLLQFSRFFETVSARATKVLLRCHPRMRKIMSLVRGIAAVHSDKQPPPPHDARVLLYDLPTVLKLKSPAVSGPYLNVDPPKSVPWTSESQFNIGICWQGNPDYEEDHHRSIPLKAYQPLLKEPRVNVYSLQKFHGVDQLNNLEQSIRPINLADKLDLRGNAFEDTAGIVGQLDLVISSDTSIVHLAGAMGVTAWVLLPFAPDWRWELASNTSSWYPTLRLFRQPKPGDWSSVMNEVYNALQTLLNKETKQ